MSITASFLFVALSFVTAPAQAADPEVVAQVAQQIPEAAFESPVLVIGESHRQPRSHALTEQLIHRALHDGRCVTFALEVPDDQIDVWRRAATDASVLEEIELSPIHDSSSLSALLRSTAQLSRDTCLELAAIDRPRHERVSRRGERDGYMAERIAEVIDAHRLVIALVGSNHAPRRHDWDYDEPRQTVTYHLAEQSIEAFVILQDFVEREAVAILRGDKPRTVAAFNRLQSHLSTVEAKSFSRYADLLIQWPSRRESGR